MTKLHHTNFAKSCLWLSVTQIDGHCMNTGQSMPLLPVGYILHLVNDSNSLLLPLSVITCTCTALAPDRQRAFFSHCLWLHLHTHVRDTRYYLGVGDMEFETVLGWACSTASAETVGHATFLRQTKVHNRAALLPWSQNFRQQQPVPGMSRRRAITWKASQRCSS